MSEHIWEEIVQGYLTTSRSIFVSRQYQISDEYGWQICPDLLAMDFNAHQVWFVEVTTGSDTTKIRNKAKQFKAEIVPRLKTQLTNARVISDFSQWSFGLWAFVRKTSQAKLRASIERYVDAANVEALEDTAFAWEYWDKRRADENGPRSV